MTEYLVLAVVIVAALIAHFGLFAWVRFKADEGSIVKALQDDDQPASTDQLAGQTGISANRVEAVCQKSPLVRRDTAGNWQTAS